MNASTEVEDNFAIDFTNFDGASDENFLLA
jgi:hypothetical protein